MKKTVKHILAEYGAVALVVHFSIAIVVFLGFWIAIRAGWRASSTAGSVGSFAAAYVAYKLTQPVRIAVTLLLTPLVARLYERVVGKRGEKRHPDAAPSAESREPRTDA